MKKEYYYRFNYIIIYFNNIVFNMRIEYTIVIIIPINDKITVNLIDYVVKNKLMLLFILWEDKTITMLGGDTVKYGSWDDLELDSPLLIKVLL